MGRLLFFGPRQFYFPEDAIDGLAAVHAVNMKTRHVIAQQIFNLDDGILDAVFFRLGGFILQSLDLFSQLGRNIGAAHRNDALNLLIV
jgi:hypothetical protein